VSAARVRLLFRGGGATELIQPEEDGVCVILHKKSGYADVLVNGHVVGGLFAPGEITIFFP